MKSYIRFLLPFADELLALFPLPFPFTMVLWNDTLECSTEKQRENKKRCERNEISAVDIRCSNEVVFADGNEAPID